MSVEMRRIVFMSALLVAVLVSILLAALWVSVERARESARLVVHSHTVLDAIDGLDVHALNLEAGQRGLLVSTSPRFRRERTDAIEGLQAGVATLLRLTSGDREQVQRFRELADHINRRVDIAIANEVMAGIDLASARRALESPEAAAASATIRGGISDIRAAERKLLESRRLEEARLQEQTLLVLGVAVAGSVVLIVVALLAFRRQALARERTELRFQDLVQALPVSLWQLRLRKGEGPVMEFISENAAALGHLDAADARRDYAAVEAVIVPEDQPKILQQMQASRETLQPLDVQYRIRAEGGGERWIQSRARVRRDSDGSVLWSGYWADITAERALQRALAEATEAANQATQAKSAFLAAMSHEIRTPMNGVLGLLELLELSQLDDEQRSTLKVVRESGRSLLRIVDDILDFSKIEAGRMALNPQPTAVREAVDRVIHIHRTLASGRGVLLQARIDERIAPGLLLDGQRLGQVLNNLVSNAIKFTERGSVTIEARLEGEDEGAQHLRFEVVDTGIGIEEADMQRLFKPFAQASAETASRFGGTGLGLVISRHLVEMMGGTLEMHSRRGVGTTMVVRCAFARVHAPDEHIRPAAAAFQVPAVRPAPSIAQAVAEGTLVLVVDDHPTNRMVMRRQVQSLGYAAETAADGKLALQAWRSGRFGLLLADCNMPEMDGYELVRAIRAEEAARNLPRTPIVACTANAMPSERTRCEQAGMDGFLVKPASLRELGLELARWLPLPQHDAMTASPADLGAPLDLSLLAALAPELDLQAELLAEFAQANDADARSVREALDAGDAPRVASGAHRMKGACLSMGAGPLGQACLELEQAARAADLASVRARMPAFEHELSRLSLWLAGRGGDAPAPSGAAAMANVAGA